MQRALKRIAALVGAAAILLVGLAIALPFWIDPNDYRDEIGALVQKKTGRELTIDGEISLSVFPWLGVEIGAMVLSNAPEFKPEPFARITRADVKVKLLPLLQRKVEMDTVVLHGLELHLGRRADGRSNWDDLVRRAQGDGAERPAAAQPAQAVGALVVSGIELRGATVVWDDRQAGVRYSARDLDLESGLVSLQAPFPVRLAFHFDSSRPVLTGRVELSAQLLLDLTQQRYRADGLDAVAELRGDMLPGGAASAHLGADVAVDLAQQTATVSQLQLDAQGIRLVGEVRANRLLDQAEAGGHLTLTVEDAPVLLKPFAAQWPSGFKPAALNGARLESNLTLSLAEQRIRLPDLKLTAVNLAAQGEVQIRELLAAPQASGRLTLTEFVPRDVLQTLGMMLPPMADPATLTKARLAFTFAAGADYVQVDKLEARVDDSTLSGEATLRDFQRPHLRYALMLDTLDADRYLPPPVAEAAPATPATAAATAATRLPLDLLRRVDVQGTVRVGALKAMNLRSSELHATLQGREGVFRLQPLGAHLYEGIYQGNLAFDVRGEVPVSSLDERLNGVQAGPLLKDFLGQERLTGKASLSAQLTMRGLDAASVRSSLNGQAAFRFEDGMVKGINVAQLIRKAYATYKNQPAPPEEAQQTDFSELKGTLHIKEGLVSNQDLSAKSPLLRVDGKGTAHLVSEAIDYRIDATVVGSLEGQGGKELAELKGLTVPLRIGGTFGAPKYSVDLAGLLEGRAKQAVEAEKKKLEQQLQKDVEQKLKGILKF